MFAFAKAQVSTSSSTPTADQTITIIFDATGTALENTTQTIHLYAGVTINNVAFQNVKGDFFTNDTAINPTFTKTGQNLFEITLGPTLNEYFGVDPTTETITAIDLVIRNANGPNGNPGSNSNKPKQTDDFKLQIFPPGLIAVITSPKDDNIYAVNEQIVIKGNSSMTSTLSLTVNGSSVATANSTSISYPFTFTAPGSYDIVFTAINGNETATDAINVFVPATVQNQVRPSGIKNGVNENSDGSVTFLLAAPGKSSSLLIGSFNDWNPSLETQMKKDGDYFWVTLPATTFTKESTFKYQYIVDDKIKIADPFSTLILDPGSDPFIKAGNFPNLPVYPTGKTTGDLTLYTYQKAEYNWNVTDFARPDNENLVIYELLVRDFSESDSFQAVIDKIDYLTGLGINAVEFMPLNEFEGTDSWGYNPKFHGALDKAYGTPEKFKELVDLLHSRGIAVIVDIVYNQAFSQSPLVQMWPDASGFNAGSDNPYLNETAKHPFSVGTDFNHESRWTKEYVKQTMQYFLSEFKIDGFRFDLSKGFTQNNTSGNVELWGKYDQSRVDILTEYRDFLLVNNDDDIYLILEHLSENQEEKALADIGFMLWGKMTQEYKQNSLGYSSQSDLSRAYHANRDFKDLHLVSYAESHDEERVVYQTLKFGNNSNPTYQVKSLSVALDRQEAIAAIQYSIPGPKMLWQFGELGYDKELNNDRLARKPVAFSNGYSTDANRLDLYKVTGEIIKLKTKYPATFNSVNNELDLSGLVKRIQLKGAEFDVIVVANFDVITKNMAPQFTETGTWYEYFSKESMNVTNQNALITLEPGGYRLFSNKALSTTASVTDSVIENTIRLFPNPTSSSFRLSMDVAEIKIYTMTGQLVKRIEGSKELYNISDLSTGVYLIKVLNTDGSSSSIKFIKKATE